MHVLDEAPRSCQSAAQFGKRSHYCYCESLEDRGPICFNFTEASLWVPDSPEILLNKLDCGRRLRWGCEGENCTYMSILSIRYQLKRKPGWVCCKNKWWPYERYVQRNTRTAIFFPEIINALINYLKVERSALVAPITEVGSRQQRTRGR
jgi:hypothetical protein